MLDISVTSWSILVRDTFFGDLSSQFFGCTLPVGLLCVGDVTCPSACCAANDCGGLPGEIVDDGDSGPMFVTNKGPIPGGGIGDPGTSRESRGREASKYPRDWDGLTAEEVGRSGASLVSRECATDGGWEIESIESDANGSSPTREDELAFAVPGPARNEVGGGARPGPAAAAPAPTAAPAVLGPMTSSMMRLRSTEFDALTIGSTSTLGWPGGGQTDSRKIEPVSERMPRR